MPEVVAQAVLQAQGFCMWLVLSAQFLATSTSSVVAGLPDWLYHLYTIVSFFNISSSYVSYEGCESGYRFQSSLVIMIGASLLAMAQAALLCVARKRSGLAAAVGLAGSTMNALYSVVLKQCLQFLHCSPSAHGGFDFTGGVATTRVELLPDGTTRTETVYLRCAPTWLFVAHGRVQATHPGCRCWVGEHLPLGLLAIFLLFFFVMALPLVTFIAVQRLVRGRSRFEMDDGADDNEISDEGRMWKAFFPGDYKAEYFWVRHLSWAVLVIICAAKEFWQVPTRTVLCR
jgi:hypothetical protein